MRLHVADPIRWARAKRRVRGGVCIASVVTAIVLMGGLEGTDQPPSFWGAMLFLGIAVVTMPDPSNSPLGKDD